MYVLPQIPCHIVGEGNVNYICITADSWFCSKWLIQKNVHVPNAHWALLLLPPDCIDPKGAKQQCVYWHFWFVVSFNIIVKIILFVQQWVYRNSASVCVQYIFSVTERNILIMFFQMYVHLFIYSLHVWRTEHENGTW